MKWKTYQPVTYDGETYGLKNVEFMKFKHLPQLTDQSLEIAMAGQPPVKELEDLGWCCRDSLKICPTIEAYQAYLCASRGEWSIAKNGYVKTRSGWFSERSACYLASGRPVVVQDTGFSDWLPTGDGVLLFTTSEEAVTAIKGINQRYTQHARAAREVAVAHFNAGTVLTELVERVLSPA